MRKNLIIPCHKVNSWSYKGRVQKKNQKKYGKFHNRGGVSKVHFQRLHRHILRWQIHVKAKIVHVTDEISCVVLRDFQWWKWSSFRKKITLFFPLLGGGGPDQKVEFSTFFEAFPHYNIIVISFSLKRKKSSYPSIPSLICIWEKLWP